MKKKILVISWFFPPVNSSEGLVTYKLLNNSENKYDVYTQNNSNLWAYKNSDDIPINNNINRICSKSKTLEEFKNDAILYFKDNIDKYDIIMTRSMPETCHEIGLSIKEINPNIKWIASFGDPIAENPFTIKAIDLENPYSLKMRYKRAMGIKEIFSIKRLLKSCIYNHRIKSSKKDYLLNNNSLQKKIINECDYVIYNSVNQQNYMLKAYENKNDLIKKSIILPHSYDPKLYSQDKLSIQDNKKITFTYVGHLDDIRTPRLIFEALNDLNSEFGDLSKKVEFKFYGNMSDNDKLYLLNNELLDIVKIKKNVTYNESLKIMQNSDWLIHIDANIQDIIPENIFFAAKLADYLGAENKIIGITMLDGISADILRENNALVISHSKEDIKNYLYLIIYENYNIIMDINARQKYNSQNVAKLFDKKIIEIEKK